MKGGMTTYAFKDAGRGRLAERFIVGDRLPMPCTNAFEVSNAEGPSFLDYEIMLVSAE